MAVFKINNTDFSGHLLAGAYKMGTAEKLFAWTDGDGRQHQRVIRKYMTGSFDLFFKTLEEYQAFIDAADASKQANSANYVTATLTDNMTNEDVTGHYYLTYAPVRNRDVNFNDYVERFTVTAEEY